MGAFLNELRAELVRGCNLRSHVTLLPPRLLASAPEVLTHELARRIPCLRSFDITLGDIEIFDSTGVIYLGLRRGERELREMHDRLSEGVFAFDEPFPFHPHITLAQEIPADRRQEYLNHAQARWRACPHDRTFTITDLTFVRNVNRTRWDALSEYVLQPARLRRTA